MSSKKDKVQAKVVMLGTTAVGKSCLVRRILTNKFKNEAPTVGRAFGAKEVTVDGKSVTLGIWDTAGSERFESLTKQYYKDAAAAVICYDVTNIKSYEKVKFWAKEVLQSEEQCSIVVVGCKLDLVEEGGEQKPQQRCVSKNQAKKFADSLPAPYFEVSALKDDEMKVGDKCIAPFEHCAREWFKSPNKGGSGDNGKSVLLDDGQEKNTSVGGRARKTGCCG